MGNSPSMDDLFAEISRLRETLNSRSLAEVMLGENLVKLKGKVDGQFYEAVVVGLTTGTSRFDVEFTMGCFGLPKSMLGAMPGATKARINQDHMRQLSKRQFSEEVADLGLIYNLDAGGNEGSVVRLRNLSAHDVLYLARPAYVEAISDAARSTSLDARAGNVALQTAQLG